MLLQQVPEHPFIHLVEMIGVHGYSHNLFQGSNLISILVQLHVTHTVCCFLTLNLDVGQTGAQNRRNCALNLVAGEIDQVDTIKIMASTLSVVHLDEEEAE